MKTIGLLGGMSWVSTAHYYERINSEIASRLGGEHCASLMLWQTDFDEITAYQRAGDWDSAGNVLASGTRSLVHGGATVIGICANTMHLVADQVREAAYPTANLVHIVEATRDACAAIGAVRIGLFGTAYTMESPTLFPPIMTAAGIEIVTPSVEDRALIHQFTFDELVRNHVSPQALATFQRVADQFVADGCDAIVLACTEHAMVLPPSAVTVPVLDTTEIHTSALVAAALS